MKRAFWLIYAIFLLMVLCGAFFVGLLLSANKPVYSSFLNASQKQDAPPIVAEYKSGLYSKNFYDAAYAGAGEVSPVNDVSSAVVAHHLIIADQVARVFQTIGNKQTKTVVLLSPNHFSVGQSPLQVSLEAWSTPYGIVESDQAAVSTLLAADASLKQEESAFANEHGIGLITPFVKRSFPKAKIVAILIDDSLGSDQADEIGRAIAQELPNAVVIASVDMSHYLPSAAQTYHDDVTLDAFNTGGGETELEVDSDAALRALFSFNRTLGKQVWHETYHDSSLSGGATTDWRENTSHILGYFSEGIPSSGESVSLQFVGDIMLDRGVRKQIDAAGTVAYPWQEMGRFLSGSSLTIGNLEGTVNEQASTYTYDPPFRFVFSPESVAEMAKYIDIVSLANNHTRDVGYAGEMETRERLDGMNEPWFGSWATPAPRFDTMVNDKKITFIGYHAFQPDEDELVRQISEAKAEGQFIIVMPHWGVEYQNQPSSEQRRLAKKMVDAGADLIIGSHPHVVQGMEVIDGVPVVYSLGNFVFDQEIPATWNATSVGVILHDDSATIYFMPIYTRYGQPVPLSDADASSVLQTIANASPQELQSSILNGKITVTYE